MTHNQHTTKERRTKLHANTLVHRRLPGPATLVVGLLATLVAALALSAGTARAEEGSGDPNDYSCRGGIQGGQAEAGSNEAQVQYTFTCSGPITGYQLQAQIPLTGFQASPLVTIGPSDEPTNDSFACGGEVPGYAVNCVGASKDEYEKVVGQFSIGAPVCAEPRVDPLLTVTYAYLEKGIVTQAISGPFDLGRPLHCPADGHNAGTRLAPREVAARKSGKHGRKHRRKSTKSRKK